MSPDSPRSSQLSGSGARMHRHWFSDDESIRDEFSDGLAGVGIRNFVHFIGVEPNLALSATDDGGGEALLGAKVDPGEVMDCQLAGLERGIWNLWAIGRHDYLLETIVQECLCRVCPCSYSHERVSRADILTS